MNYKTQKMANRIYGCACTALQSAHGPEWALDKEMDCGGCAVSIQQREMCLFVNHVFVHQIALIFSLLVPKEAFFGYVAVCGFGTTLQNTALIINKSPVVIVMNYQIIISDSYPV